MSPRKLYRDYRVLYWGYIGIMEKKMETTIMGLYRVLGFDKAILPVFVRRAMI